MVELTKETFEAEVLKAEGTVLVDFYGDGCVPCQALMPHVHAMEDTYGKDIKFTALNTTSEPGNRPEGIGPSGYRSL